MSQVNDVNEAFDSQKFAQLKRKEDRKAWLDGQVKDGKMRQVGNKYIVTVGWDAGEVFMADSLKAVTGLDLTSDGRTAFASRVPEWHALGQTKEEGWSSASELLHDAGLDYRVLQKPASVVFSAEEMAEHEGELVSSEQPTVIDVPDLFVNYRSDTLAPLGVVGNRYTPVQNREAYSFLDELLDWGMIAETAGSFNGGRRIFISTRLPEDVIVDAEGIADIVRPYLIIVNSHDGSTPVQCVVSPWRPRCSNTERLALRNAVTRWNVRHTKNAMQKIEEARKALGLTQNYIEEFAKEETELLRVPMKPGEIRRLAEEIWEFDPADASKITVTRNNNRIQQIEEIYASISGELGSNAYTFERAVTDYVDHYAELRPRGDLKGNRLAAEGTRLLEGTTDDIKGKAHKRLMVLTKR